MNEYTKEELRAIVDRLKKTADGAPITLGMPVWIIEKRNPAVSVAVQGHVVRLDLRDNYDVMVRFGEFDERAASSAELYSTEQAGKAAIG